MNISKVEWTLNCLALDLISVLSSACVITFASILLHDIVTLLGSIFLLQGD